MNTTYKQSNSRGICVCWCLEMYVWIAPGWHYCTGFIKQVTDAAQLPPKPDSAWTMEEWLETNPVCLYGSWFCSEICGKRACRECNECVKVDYKIADDWIGGTFIMCILDWDYKNQDVHISMPGYRLKVLQCFPLPHVVPPILCQSAVCRNWWWHLPPDTKEEKLFIQKVTGMFLY